jgi:hypothetical protein
MTPPKRPRGRPRIDPECRSVNVHVRLSERAYDKVCEAATRDRVSVADALRNRIGHNKPSD